MHIGVPKETWPGERRVALVPQNAKKLINLGFTITLESGAGDAAGFIDAAYEEVGVALSADHNQILANADLILRVRKPDSQEIASAQKGCHQHQLFRPL